MSTVISVLTVAALIVLFFGVLRMFFACMVHNRRAWASGLSMLTLYGIPIVALRAYLLDSSAGWVALGLYLVIIVLGVILTSKLMVKFHESRFSK